MRACVRVCVFEVNCFLFLSCMYFSWDDITEYQDYSIRMAAVGIMLTAEFLPFGRALFWGEAIARLYFNILI